MSGKSVPEYWYFLLTWMMAGYSFFILCPLGVFPALAFVAAFPPVALKFHQRTHRVRLRNLGTTDKKSSHKIKHRKIPREPFIESFDTELLRAMHSHKACVGF